MAFPIASAPSSRAPSSGSPAASATPTAIGEETSLEADNDESGNKNAIQAVGSAATYLQRYTLKLALGLAASNDDDAQGAAEAQRGIEADDIAFIEQQIRDTNSDLVMFLQTIGAPSVAEMNIAQFKRATALLSEKKRRAAAK